MTSLKASFFKVYLFHWVSLFCVQLFLKMHNHQGFHIMFPRILEHEIPLMYLWPVFVLLSVAQGKNIHIPCYSGKYYFFIFAFAWDWRLIGILKHFYPTLLPKAVSYMLTATIASTNSLDPQFSYLCFSFGSDSYSLWLYLLQSIHRYCWQLL